MKVLEPAGTRWKKFTLDADGNITRVEEPGSLFTDYSYNVFGNLSTATMTRSGVTQTRTWNYDPATQRLLSVTLPETGTTSFTYDAQGLVASKTDAKLQRIEYVRDSHNRVTQIKRFNASGLEQVAQRTTFEYDTTENGWGRLGRVYYKSGNERFDYTAGGLIKKKTLFAQYYLTLECGYNNEGALVSTKLPQAYERVSGIPQPLPVVTGVAIGEFLKNNCPPPSR